MAEQQVESTTNQEEVKQDVSANGSLPLQNLPAETSSKDEQIAEAASALTHGKRNLLIKDVPMALSSLGEACRLYSELIGSFTAESGESHYYYGKALLESARSELSVLPQEALGKVEEDADDDEEEDEDQEKVDEEEEEKSDEEKTDEEKKLEPEVEDVEKEGEEDIDVPSPGPEKPKESVDEVPGPSDGPSTSTNGVAVDEEKPSTSTELDASTATEGGDEEPSSLELAWEVLEIAKLAYQRQLEYAGAKLIGIPASEDDRKEEMEKLQETITVFKRKLADTHLLLGEVATESESYVQAEGEFRTALTVLRDTEGEDSREVAQCYFQLGLAYYFDKKFVESIDSFQTAVSLIKKRIGNLETLISNKETKKDKGIEPTDPSYTEEKEIEELKALLPELEEKVADTIDAQKDSAKTQEEDKMEQEILQRNSPVKNPQPGAVNNISHLVKKKKKLDDEDKVEPPAKKQCLENGNGISPTNGQH